MTSNFVYMVNSIGRSFNLTATVESNLNLISLYWSPPKSFDHLPSRIITVHHDNITSTTYILLEDAILGDNPTLPRRYTPYGYTLTAVNECGQNSLLVDVVFLFGK